MAEAWGPWIEHSGDAMPVSGDTVVAVRFLEVVGTPVGNPEGDLASVWSWWREGWGLDITHYRIRRPDALLSLIDLAESVEHIRPETIKALVGV